MVFPKENRQLSPAPFRSRIPSRAKNLTPDHPPSLEPCRRCSKFCPHPETCATTANSAGLSIFHSTGMAGIDFNTDWFCRLGEGDSQRGRFSKKRNPARKGELCRLAPSGGGPHLLSQDRERERPQSVEGLDPALPRCARQKA